MIHVSSAQIVVSGASKLGMWCQLFRSDEIGRLVLVRFWSEIFGAPKSSLMASLNGYCFGVGQTSACTEMHVFYSVSREAWAKAWTDSWTNRMYSWLITRTGVHNIQESPQHLDSIRDTLNDLKPIKLVSVWRRQRVFKVFLNLHNKHAKNVFFLFFPEISFLELGYKQLTLLLHKCITKINKEKQTNKQTGRGEVLLIWKPNRCPEGTKNSQSCSTPTTLHSTSPYPTTPHPTTPYPSTPHPKTPCPTIPHPTPPHPSLVSSYFFIL